ncbi:hypothetical protein LPJ53_000489 [Coemansia erecta]|uniref:Anti-proliferative protein domain-containing protein n=1 Tax=Coemansia erecta TaxID=147472 RepID=A0A9W7Y7S3_9FUNG|nr:hypothetical protein LPJ53_000489 [Coemansia erecta]
MRAQVNVQAGMQTEIDSAATFWLRFVQDGVLAADKKEALRQSLISVLHARYTGHWHPEQTNVGSAYRSLSNWRRLDSAFIEAAQQAGVAVELLERSFPRDIVLWCDPYNVTYRVGDHGTVYTVYEDKRGLLESVKKSMAERVSKSNGDFVLSAYTTPVVIRSADGVEISRRGGPAGSPQAMESPTKGAAEFRRANAMSPLRQVAYRGDQGGAGNTGSPLANAVGKGPAASRWSPSTAQS